RSLVQEHDGIREFHDLEITRLGGHAAHGDEDLLVRLDVLRVHVQMAHGHAHLVGRSDLRHCRARHQGDGQSHTDNPFRHRTSPSFRFWPFRYWIGSGRSFNSIIVPHGSETKASAAPVCAFFWIGRSIFTPSACSFFRKASRFFTSKPIWSSTCP